MSWNRLRLVTPASVLPVSLVEAKAHLRVDFDDDDALIASLISAATAMLDGPRGIGVALAPQTWELGLDEWPEAVRLPLWPVRAIASIIYKDAAGADVTLPTSAWQADLDASPVRILPDYGQSWPAARASQRAIRITFTAGYADAASIPADLKAALLLIVGHLYNHREAVADNSPRVLPMGAEAIIDRYRIWL